MKASIHSYKSGWQFLYANKLLVGVLYVFNIVLAFLAIGPFDAYLKSIFKNSDAINTLAQRFDYNIIMDVYNHYGFGIGVTLSSFFSYFLIYVIWSVFVSAGILGLYSATSSGEKAGLSLFWKNGIAYFFRFFRLTVYILLAYASVIALCAFYFSLGELNVFKMESEIAIIQRFWLLAILLVLLGFFISIFRDIARSQIVLNNQAFIFKSNWSAFKSIIKPRYIFLSVINLIVLGLMTLVYFGLKNLFGNSTILLIILSQAYLIFKLCYRIVRGVSFLKLKSENATQ